MLETIAQTDTRALDSVAFIPVVEKIISVIKYRTNHCIVSYASYAPYAVAIPNSVNAVDYFTSAHAARAKRAVFRNSRTRWPHAVDKSL